MNIDMGITSEELLFRIQRIFRQCSKEEQLVLKEILQELAMDGVSKIYRDVWLSDYKEIPVDIETFMRRDAFLGKTNRQGNAVYPFWMRTLKEIFDAGNKYEEVVLTGATRIGKSSTAIAGTAYMLYKLMCLRDPQKYFNKKDVSKFAILFFNVTKDLAKGVAFREFNDTLNMSPWFMEHGTISKSDRDFFYIPEGGKVVIEYGSSGSHALGMQVYCVAGNTLLLTPDGPMRIDALADSIALIGQVNPYTDEVDFVPATIKLTKYAEQLIHIQTSTKGVWIEGTPEHMVLTREKQWKMLHELLPGDALYDPRDPRGHEISSILSYNTYMPVYDVIEAAPHHNFIITSEDCDNFVVAHNCAFSDEMNFSQAGIKDVAKAKSRMKDTYNTISARVKGTFRKDGEVHGKIFAVSSKRSDSDFLETYVEEQKSAGAGDHIYVAEGPQWDILPPGTFSEERFYVAVGNRHQKGFVVPKNQSDPAALKDIEAQGFRLLNPPVDMLADFTADFEIALRDLAGISVPGALSFITQEAITSCITHSRRNPFYSEILSIGTKDNLTLEEFFHLEDVPQELKRMPMFIHLDLSLNTDNTGISGVAVSGRKMIEGPDGKSISQPTFSHVFSISLAAPRGDKIPYAKITEFICWLRRSGFNISRLSRDQFQSEYMAQLLEAQGFTVDKLSLDRTPDGYQAFRSILLEQRIEMLDYKKVQDELISLQRDAITGRVDHPIGGSKDVSDSLAGATWNAMLNNTGIPVATKTVSHAISAINGAKRGGYGRSPQLPSMFPGYTKR